MMKTRFDSLMFHCVKKVKVGEWKLEKSNEGRTFRTRKITLITSVGEITITAFDD